MKTTVKMLVTLLFLLFLSPSGFSQAMGSEYRTALGVKFFPGALSVKHFTGNNALEGLGYFYRDGFRFTGLYEIHGPLGTAPGLRWYIGPGAHFGIWNNDWRRRNPAYTGPDYISAGLDGVLGLDYKFTGAPINISLDWQPSLNLIGTRGFEFGWGGLAIRYAF